MDLAMLSIGGNRQIARLVSEDHGETWRVAERDDEVRDDLLWDSLFAPPNREAAVREAAHLQSNS